MSKKVEKENNQITSYVYYVKCQKVKQLDYGWSSQNNNLDMMRSQTALKLAWIDLFQK